MQLIIKGTPQQAVNAANRFGIALLSIKRQRYSSWFDYDVVAITRTDDARLHRWFQEGPTAPPFPPGALLFFSRTA